MNWISLIRDLRERGYTQSQIAAAIGVKQSTIAGVLSGAQTDFRWATGERLRTLHEQVMAQPALEPAKEGA